MKLAFRRESAWPFEPGEDADAHLRESFRILRSKWGEVPAGETTRVMSQDLLELSDADLLRTWTECYRDTSTGKAYSVRGWYHVLYRDIFRGKKIMDIGSGLGIDGIYYAQHGAEVTFVDLAPSNLQVVERLCKIKGLSRTRFCYLEDLQALDELPADYDAIYCCGSLIHAPLKTDGGAPWVEWHDLDKVNGFLAPARFDTVFAFNFHNNDFNWFDLIRRA